MSAAGETAHARVRAALARRARSRRPGDLILGGLAAIAGISAAVLLVLLASRVAQQAGDAISRFGLGFITSTDWNPVTGRFGAWSFIFGTLLTSGIALLLAVPLAVAIALYLTELAPRRLRAAVASLVELLAAIPSVVLGMWGILVLGPFVSDRLEPFLGSVLGFLPLFSGTPSSVGILPAVLILTIMVIPIVASISRELLLGVPRDTKEGALALGATRWEMVRAVMLPAAGPGIAAAAVLGLGRALGEAIAVTQVIGGSTGVHWSLFGSADTLASRIASQYEGATSNLQIASIAYLAVILLVISLVANVVAQLIVRRMERAPVA